MPPRQISFKASIYPCPKGQITLQLLWSQTWETFQQVTVPCHHSHHNRSSSFRRHTFMLLIQPLQQLMPLPFGSWIPPSPLHAMTPTGIVAPHPTLTTSPTGGITHATPQTGTGSHSSKFHCILHRKHSQEKKSHFQDLQLPINPIPRLSPSRIPLPDSDSNSDPLNY